MTTLQQPATPTPVDPQVFDRLEKSLTSNGPEAAFDILASALVERGEFHRLFDALTMKARHELGRPLVNPGSANDWPEEVRSAYEEKVIAACRTVGQHFLDAGDLANAYQYFNMIGETGPVRAAIESFEPGPEEDDAAAQKVDALIEVAVTQGVHPRRGLQLILERYGTCNAITSAEGILAQGVRNDDHVGCVKLLVHKLHEELLEHLRMEVAAREPEPAAGASISLLLKGRDWLFEDGAYHVDTSHLNAVVRMARMIPKCDEIYLAMQLCEYGTKLDERYVYADPAPFDDVYKDSLIYFRMLMGQDVESGLAHFEKKAKQANMDEVGTYPAEVYVRLLHLAGRVEDAIAYAARKLNTPPRVPLGSTAIQTINDICQESHHYDDMAKLAQRRGDLLSFTAGLLQKQA